MGGRTFEILWAKSLRGLAALIQAKIEEYAPIEMCDVVVGPIGYAKGTFFAPVEVFTYTLTPVEKRRHAQRLRRRKAAKKGKGKK